MRHLKCLVASIFITSSLGVCQEVEYYPSQANLNNMHTIEKRSSDNIETKTKYKIVHKNNWRHFNKVAANFKVNKTKRAVDPVFHGHPKTREELWHEHFLNKSTAFDQTPSLIKLIHNITLKYLNDCIPVILYDNQVKSKESYLFQNLLKGFPVSYVHGYIGDDNKLKEPELLVPGKQCLHFIIFSSEVKSSVRILGKQSESKVVVVARSSQWAVQEFLSSSTSRMFINLLVIAQSFKDDNDETMVSLNQNLIEFQNYTIFYLAQIKKYFRIPRKRHTFCIRTNCIPMDWAPASQ